MLRNKARQTALVGTVPPGPWRRQLPIEHFHVSGRAPTCNYTRAGNPTRDVLTDLATGLEG
jgi:hypothetical protein